MPRTIFFTHESETTCRERLLGSGYGDGAAEALSGLLSGGRILEESGDALKLALRLRGLAFVPVEMDRLGHLMGCLKPDLFWFLTDGPAPFRGGLARATAAASGFAGFGAAVDDAALCRNVSRLSLVLAGLGLPVMPPVKTMDGVGEGEAAAFLVRPDGLGVTATSGLAAFESTAGAATAKASEQEQKFGVKSVVQRLGPGALVRVHGLGDFRGAFSRKSGGRDWERLQGGDGDAAIALMGEVEDAIGLCGAFAVDLWCSKDGTLAILGVDTVPDMGAPDFSAFATSLGLSVPDLIADAALKAIV